MICTKKKNLLTTPKVSVIIPVYNVEKYLRECLDSVVNQTLKEIEIILIDDGSTDSSLDICREYAEKDSRIQVYTQENRGAGAARNRGIRIAKGEYVAFIDADDFYFSKNSLLTLYSFARLKKVDICGGEFLNYNDVSQKMYQNFGYINNSGYLFKKDQLISFIDYQFDYGYHRFIYKRDFITEKQLYFPDYLRFEDPSFFVRALEKVGKFYVLKLPVYSYRMYHKEVKWNSKKINDLLRGIMDNILFAQQKGLRRLFDLSYIRLYEHFKYIASFLDADSYKLLSQLKTINPFMTKYLNMDSIKLCDEREVNAKK
ncbi:MAG: glycosyltransferase family 2 protein [Alphaproteobacteria bacterium]|nr:glycosyltransferase family 2 protein [Alphaproteobacteria bacterium]